jgi:hypothetical protein
MSLKSSLLATVQRTDGVVMETKVVMVTNQGCHWDDVKDGFQIYQEEDLAGLGMSFSLHCTFKMSTFYFVTFENLMGAFAHVSDCSSVA